MSTREVAAVVKHEGEKVEKRGGNGDRFMLMVLRLTKSSGVVM
jgi:hypothetical protein